jgi:hypothetical protein
MCARRDVEKHHLIRALVVVAHGQFDRVTDFAQAAGLGAPELHAAGHFSVVNVEAGDHTFGQHEVGDGGEIEH